MIDWLAFVSVVVSAIVAACVVVTLFSLALRLGDGEEPWRKRVSVALFVLCGIFVLFGIYLIVPALHQLSA
jgi:hypothetical protein